MRGTALASPGLLTGSRWLDAELTLLGSAPQGLRGGAAVWLLTGTVETATRLPAARPRPAGAGGTRHGAGYRNARGGAGRRAFHHQDALPPATIGGGRILHPVSRRRRRHECVHWRCYGRWRNSSPAEILAHRLRAAGNEGCGMAELARLLADIGGAVALVSEGCGGSTIAGRHGTRQHGQARSEIHLSWRWWTNTTASIQPNRVCRATGWEGTRVRSQLADRARRVAERAGPAPASGLRSGGTAIGSRSAIDRGGGAGIPDREGWSRPTHPPSSETTGGGFRRFAT